MASPLLPGTTLGPYEIQAQVGAGGMGRVYKARDTRLDRIVAIKILTSDPAEPAAERERFEREARAISSLNHPNICTLYDVGEQPAGTSAVPLRYLVMEFVDGESLAVRLQRGPLPLPQALTFAIQVADALDRVHRKGIVHGDLKPGNVMLTKAGVKLLDFGLARQRHQAPPSGWPDADTRTMPVVTAGSLLGTLQYLAPEQIEGKESDQRSDIFACGAVIYEMVTGRKAFDGETHAAVMAAILKLPPPPISTLQPQTPPALEHVVTTCLAKDPDDRWQDAGDLTRQLRWIDSAASAAVPAVRPARSWLGAALAAAIVVAALALAAVWSLERGTAPDVPATRTSILLPEGLQFPAQAVVGGVERFAISPDGRRIAFAATDASGNQALWLRPLGSMAASPIAGTDGATAPFWAPDSRRLGFFARGQLKIVDPDRGAPVAVTAPALGASGSWNADDVILFTPTGGSALHQVPASGGTPRPVTRLDNTRADVLHRNPFFLPDGRHFLYVAVSAREGDTTAARALYVGSLDDGAEAAPVQVLDAGTMAKYAQGQLLFTRDNVLMAQAFDVRSFTLTGEPTMIAEQLEPTGPLSAAFTVSENGILAYQAASGPGSQLVWLDRQGRPQGVLGDPARYADLELSPDGRLAIVSVLDPGTNTRDLWMFDVDRGVRTRFTLDRGDDVAPIWSPDGTRVVFASNRQGHFDLYEKTVSGIGPETTLLVDDSEKYPTGWLPNGRGVLYWTFDAEGTRLMQLSLASEDGPRPVLDIPVNQGRLSPDGKWLAYYSAESGRFEVYVVPFPAASQRWAVSSAGGSLPRWTRDGREILFAGRDNRLMTVAVEPEGATLKVGIPRALFEARPVGPRSFFAVSPDGTRLLVNALQGESRSTAITVVQQWTTPAP